DHHRKADRADALRHRGADVLPALLRPVEAIEAAVVLLVEPIGLRGMKAYAMRIVTVFRGRVGQKVRAHAPVDGPPIAASIRRSDHAAARHADIHVPGIARVDDYRMQLPAVRCAGLIATAPCFAGRMLVEAVDTVPRRAVVHG